MTNSSDYELALASSNKTIKNLNKGDIVASPTLGYITLSGVTSKQYERLEDASIQQLARDILATKDFYTKLGLTKHQFEAFTVCLSTMYAVDRPYWALRMYSPGYTEKEYKKDFQAYLDGSVSYLVARYMLGFRGLPRLAFSNPEMTDTTRDYYTSRTV